jgi:23S rRNA (pseudouridine1915-N3)-methyltransferase
MLIELLSLGKTQDEEIQRLLQSYHKKLAKYGKFISIEKEVGGLKKNHGQTERKEIEGRFILDYIKTEDYVILLDENGKAYNSEKFAAHLQKCLNKGGKRILFIIGGPYGFSEKVYLRANEKLALSEMTFTHQMVRLFFTEQLYRAFTILNNEPYHHS